MIGISLNCNGLGSDCKKKWICDFIKSKRPVFLGIQESKLEVVDLSMIHSLWPFLNVDFGYCVSSGASGGILTLWNTNVFTKEHQIVNPNYLVTVGMWVGVSSKVGLINVYAPQSSSRKEALWVSIEHLVSNPNVIWIIFGDFNVVRSLDERS
ncbi:RNA-directed DNA polymerase, eukaryota, partial [Tanacetum coccineum]